MNKKLLLISFIISVMTSISHSAYIANRDFLSVGHGARAHAMGEAFAGVADNSSAVFWNPAGLTQLESDEISTSYADRFEGLADETHMHYIRRGRRAMWGFSYVGSFIKDIEITQALTESEIQQIGTGAFGPRVHPKDDVMDHAGIISFARPLRDGSPHSLGTSVKLIYRDFLGMVRGFGSAIDIGYFYTFPSERLRFGTNVQNVASLVSFSGSIDNLGVRATSTESYIPNVKSGIGWEPKWRFLSGRMLFSFDVNFLTTFDLESYNTGVEYQIGEIVSLRGGKIFQRQDDSGEDFSMGMGINLKGILIDFAFLTNELGETLRGTIGYRLGGNYSKPSRY